MGSPLLKLQEQVLDLSLEERKSMIHLLVDSLDEPLAELDPAWLPEMRQRYDDLISGKSQAIPADKVFADLRKELACRN